MLSAKEKEGESEEVAASSTKTDIESVNQKIATGKQVRDVVVVWQATIRAAQISFMTGSCRRRQRCHCFDLPHARTIHLYPYCHTKHEHPCPSLHRSMLRM